MAAYAAQARTLAEVLLREPLPNRWAHTLGVAQRAQALESILGQDADLVEAAAWLHDIGYSPLLIKTGFHPVDGARHIRANTTMPFVVTVLVANHTYAWIEARRRAIDTALKSEFPILDDHVFWLVDVLTYCDMTTDPSGRSTTLRGRISEILSRYEPEDIVHQAIQEATPMILQRGQLVADRLAQNQPL